MGKGIEGANYVQMRQKAGELRETGIIINYYICDVYEEVGKMFSAWKGTQYNNLVQSLINIKPSFEELLRCVVKSIPDALQKVAENYSGMETATKQEIDTVPVKSPADLSIQDTSIFRFVISDVESYKERIFQKLNHVMEKLDEFNDTMDSVIWDSDSSNADRPVFLKLKDQIKEQILSFQNSFNQFIVELTERVITTENNNDVN